MNHPERLMWLAMWLVALIWVWLAWVRT